MDLDPRRSWRHPRGPRERDRRSSRDHPVVHVAYEDAAGLRGLGRARAADRGGVGARRPRRSRRRGYTWGDEPEPDGEHLANYWHGDFPWRAEPGYGRTAAVGSFAPNGYGLADMAGNVWEWTSDWYQENRWADVAPCCAPRDPRGGTERGQPRPPTAAVPGAAQGHQGRLVPVRGQLLPALPAGGAPAADDRHRDEPHRLPLRATLSSSGRAASGGVRRVRRRRVDRRRVRRRRIRGLGRRGGGRRRRCRARRLRGGGRGGLRLLRR